MATRTARINALPGFCREFGIAIGVGSRNGVEQLARDGEASFLKGANDIEVVDARYLDQG